MNYLSFFAGFGETSGDVTYSDIQLLEVTTYPITFPVAAGTVYGGELDVTSGELKVNTITFVLDGTENWSKLDNSDPKKVYYRITQISQYTFAHGNEICSHFPKVNISTANTAIGFMSYTSSTSSIGSAAGFRPDSTIIANLAQWEAFLAEQYSNGTPVTFTCNLETPLATYHLTPTEVTLLLATNNLWCDGNTTLTMEYGEYLTASVDHADTQSRLVKALIAPVLDSMTADTALSANDFRIVGNTLYRITASVASGGTLTPGTNCTATTIGEQLAALLNA